MRYAVELSHGHVPSLQLAEMPPDVDIEIGLSGILGRCFEFDVEARPAILPELWPWLHRFRRYRSARINEAIGGFAAPRQEASSFGGSSSEEDIADEFSAYLDFAGVDFGYQSGYTNAHPNNYFWTFRKPSATDNTSIQ